MLALEGYSVTLTWIQIFHMAFVLKKWRIKIRILLSKDFKERKRLVGAMLRPASPHPLATLRLPFALPRPPARCSAATEAKEAEEAKETEGRILSFDMLRNNFYPHSGG